MMGTYGDGTDPLEQALRARVAQGARQPPGMYVPQVRATDIVPRFPGDLERIEQGLTVNQALAKYHAELGSPVYQPSDMAGLMHAANQQAAYMTEARQAPYAQAGQQLAALLQGRAQQVDARARQTHADAQAKQADFQQSPEAMQLAWAQILSQSGQPLPPGMMPPRLGGTPDPLSSLPPAAQARFAADPRTGIPAGSPADAVADLEDRGVAADPAALRESLLSRYGEKSLRSASRSYADGFEQPWYTPGGVMERFGAGKDILTGNVQRREDDAARLRRVLGRGSPEAPRYVSPLGRPHGTPGAWLGGALYRLLNE